MSFRRPGRARGTFDAIFRTLTNSNPPEVYPSVAIQATFQSLSDKYDILGFYKVNVDAQPVRPLLLTSVSEVLTCPCAETGHRQRGERDGPPRLPAVQERR